MPPFGDNSFAAASTNVIVNKIKACTPGNRSQLIGTGPSFRSIFFPKYAPLPLEPEVGPSFGQQDQAFSDWSVALLCQAMSRLIAEMQQALMPAKINAAVAAANSLTSGFPRVAWYAKALASTSGGVSSAMSGIGASARRAALQNYLDALGSQKWVDFKMAEGGNWTHSDWELYHHYVKLCALGASQPQVDGLIGTIKRLGLAVSGNVDVGTWIAYAPWGWTIDYTAIQTDALPGMTHVSWIPGGEGPAVEETNGDSWEFIANSQPGNGFRTPPPSCFSRDTQVVLADGSLRAINAVRAGEMLATPNGPKPVIHLVESLLAGRDFCRFEGAGFAFTDAHPFVAAPVLPGERSGFFAVDPVGAMLASPGIGALGVVGSERRPRLYVYGLEGDISFPGISRESPSADGAGFADVTFTRESVCDLVLDVGPDGVSEYFVGDAARQYLVSSEAPRFDDLPEATEAFVGLFENARLAIVTEIERFERIHHHDLLLAGTAGSARLLYAAIRDVQGADFAEAPPRSRDQARVRAAALLRPVVDGAGYAALRGLTGTDGMAFSILANRFGPPLRLACAMGWRRMEEVPGTLATCLLVDVDTIELDASLGISIEEGDALSIRLSMEEIVLRRMIDYPRGRMARQAGHAFHETACFTDWRPSGTDGNRFWTISFFLADRRSGRDLQAIASVPLPSKYLGQARFHAAPIFTDAGKRCGHLTFEVRTLTDTAWEVERNARAAWTPARASGFAAALGGAAGRLLGGQFPRYMRAFARGASAEALSLSQVESKN